MFVTCICFISQWIKRSKHCLFIFPQKKTLIWRRHCSIGQSCCSMTSKRNIGWFIESSWAPSFFTRAFAELTKSHMHLYLFDKPIKSLYSHLLVVSVLLASFHFKVKRKSLYHFQQVIIMATRKHPCSYCIFGHAKNLKQEDKYATTPNNNSIETAHSITVKKKIQNITTI